MFFYKNPSPLFRLADGFSHGQRKQVTAVNRKTSLTKSYQNLKAGSGASSGGDLTW